MLPEWPQFLEASALGVAVSLAVCKLTASKFAAGTNTNLPKCIVVASGVVAAAVYWATRRSPSRTAASTAFNRGQGKFRAYPSLRGCDDSRGFTATSILTRLPRIIDDIIATMPMLPAAAAAQLCVLRSEISSNDVISALPDAACSHGGHSSARGNCKDGNDDQEPDWPS
jgi:hypothetical protein